MLEKTGIVKIGFSDEEIGSMRMPEMVSVVKSLLKNHDCDAMKDAGLSEEEINSGTVLTGYMVIKLLRKYIEKYSKGEIALAILRIKMKEDGLRLFPREIKGKIKKLAEETKISEKELADFLKEEVEFLTKEVFGSL